MTRVVHLSDTHLGFRQLHKITDSGRNVREQDVYDVFSEAIDAIVALNPDIVIHAGDLFDSFLPSSAALNVALEGFARLRQAEIPAVVIAGNHSTPRLASADHIFAVLERFGGIEFIHTQPRTIVVGDVAVCAVPHLGSAEALEAALRSALPSDHAKKNVLVTHAGLSRMSRVTGPESASVVLPGDAVEAGARFDYVALGHLHQFAAVAENMAYCGSLERMSWADRAEIKGFIEVDLSKVPDDVDYLRLHEVSARPHLRLAINGSGVDDLSAAVRAEAEKHDLAEAMVQLEVSGITSAAWSALDWPEMAEVFAEAFHFEPVPILVGGPELTSPQPQLSEFIREWLEGQGLDLAVEEMITRCEGFLARADRELAE